MKYLHKLYTTYTGAVTPPPPPPSADLPTSLTLLEVLTPASPLVAPGTYIK